MDIQKLDERTAFKMGFLTRCMEEGLAGDDLQGRIKSALLGAVGTAIGTTVGLPLAAGLLAGGVGGYGAAKITEPDATDPETVKIKELEQAYKIQAARMRARRALKEYRSVR